MTINVDRFAEMTGVDKAKAYGFLRFLEDKGLIKAENEATGRKGKPRRVYHVNQDTWTNLANFLSTVVVIETPMQDTALTEEHEFVGDLDLDLDEIAVAAVAE